MSAGQRPREALGITIGGGQYPHSSHSCHSIGAWTVSEARLQLLQVHLA